MPSEADWRMTYDSVCSVKLWDRPHHIQMRKLKTVDAGTRSRVKRRRAQRNSREWLARRPVVDILKKRLFGNKLSKRKG